MNSSPGPRLVSRPPTSTRRARRASTGPRPASLSSQATRSWATPSEFIFSPGWSSHSSSFCESQRLRALPRCRVLRPFLLSSQRHSQEQHDPRWHVYMHLVRSFRQRRMGVSFLTPASHLSPPASNSFSSASGTCASRTSYFTSRTSGSTSEDGSACESSTALS